MVVVLNGVPGGTGGAPVGSGSRLGGEKFRRRTVPSGMVRRRWTGWPLRGGPSKATEAGAVGLVPPGTYSEISVTNSALVPVWEAVYFLLGVLCSGGGALEMKLSLRS